MGDPAEITIIAKGKAMRSYLAAIRGVYVPKKTVRVLSISEDGALIKKLGYSKREAVYLCAGKQCSKPITKPGKLKEELKRFLERNRMGSMKTKRKTKRLSENEIDTLVVAEAGDELVLSFHGVAADTQCNKQ
jgi:hypothetical protein